MRTNNCTITSILPNIVFMYSIRKKLIQVWNDLRVSKWWQYFTFAWTIITLGLYYWNITSLFLHYIFTLLSFVWVSKYMSVYMILMYCTTLFLLIIYCSCAPVSFLFGDQWKRHVCPLPVGGAGQWVISADWGSAGLPSTVLGDPEGARWQNTEQVSSTTHAANQLETIPYS